MELKLSVTVKIWLSTLLTKGGIVLLNKKHYLEEMHNLLSDNGTYEVLNRDPTFSYKKLERLMAKGYKKV